MEELQHQRIAVIGVGNIGRILLGRLLSAGVSPDCLAICDAEPERAAKTAVDFGIRVFSVSDETECPADVLLLAASPKAVAEVLRELSTRLHAGQVVVSFAAGIPLTRLEAIVPPGVSTVRVMPNAPSLIGHGMNPVAFGFSDSPEARAQTLHLLWALGETIEVRDDQMNWCVGLSGAAMRSVLPVLEGMTRAGVEAGLAEKDARRVAAQVMLGTASMAMQTELPFAEIKALTPMETVDEGAVAELFAEAARKAKGKIDQLQARLEG